MDPDFHQRATLLEHIQQTKHFYDQRCVDASGGFYHFYKDDGTVYDQHTRHLVSSTRFIFNYAMAWRQFGAEADRQRLHHGLDFLRRAHRNPHTEGYAWQLDWNGGTAVVTDGTNHCYGLAFVLLAYSHALLAGEARARAWTDETHDLMERRFWDAQHGLYADEASADWSQLSPYRGQNANMHVCEALIAAFEASGERRHLTEWAKLLLLLERHGSQLGGGADWLLPRARALFDAALSTAWDGKHGGIYYGFGPDGEICDDLKYFWVQAESLAAAALLGARTGAQQYWDWYDRIWAYSWEHFVDHQYGAWYRILGADNSKLTDQKSPAGKVDYHTMGACYEVLKVLKN